MPEKWELIVLAVGERCEGDDNSELCLAHVAPKWNVDRMDESEANIAWRVAEIFAIERADSMRARSSDIEAWILVGRRTNKLEWTSRVPVPS